LNTNLVQILKVDWSSNRNNGHGCPHVNWPEWPVLVICITESSSDALWTHQQTTG